jgi:hypothetical protein
MISYLVVDVLLYQVFFTLLGEYLELEMLHFYRRTGTKPAPFSSKNKVHPRYPTFRLLHTTMHSFLDSFFRQNKWMAD